MNNLFSRSVVNYKNRDSNFEILRIVSMLMVIVHHFSLWGYYFTEPITLATRRVYEIFFPLGKIAYVAFIAISMWFLIDSKFKSKKILLLYLESVFYALLLGLISTLTNFEPLSASQWVLLFIPIFGSSHPFLAIYLAFILFSPLFKKLVKSLSDKANLYLIFILFFTQILSRVIFYTFDVDLYIFSSIFFFLFIYCLIYRLKNHSLKICENKIVLLIIFLICYAINYCYNAEFIKINNTFLDELVSSLLNKEFAIIDIIAGLSLFYLFKRKKESHLTIINVFSSSTLGVLLIHDNNYFRTFFWKKIIHIDVFKDYGFKLIPIIIAIAITIFLSLSIIDLFRKHLLENNIIKIKTIDKLCLKLDDIVNDVETI